MTVFGDLETSTLTELPAGRAPIQTNVVPLGQPTWIERVWARAQEEVAKGHQVYVVCPRIDDKASGEDAPPPEEDDKRPVAAVAEVAPRLAAELAPLRVEALHGRLPSDQKDQVMQAFVRGERAKGLGQLEDRRRGEGVQLLRIVYGERRDAPAVVSATTQPSVGTPSLTSVTASAAQPFTS